MRLLEHEAKSILKDEGLAIPRGRVIHEPLESKRIATELGKVLVKAQVPFGGREKSGLILKADTPGEAFSSAQKLLKLSFEGSEVDSVLVEEHVEGKEEIFLSVTIDDSICKPIILACREGGVDIEKLATQHPEKIVSIPVDPILGLEEWQARSVAKRIGLKGGTMLKIGRLIWTLHQIFEKYAATLVEVNPAIITQNDEAYSVGAVMIIDDDALSSNHRLKFSPSERIHDEIEREAWGYGISYIRLDGDIGVIGSGAGLAIATLDLLKQYGGEPANFLDTGGLITQERIVNCLKLVTSNPKVRGVLINLYGGINPIVEAAKGIVSFVEEKRLEYPIVVKARGNFEEESWRILKASNIEVVEEMMTEVAAERVVQRVKEQNK